jgi:hypothetical protein
MDRWIGRSAGDVKQMRLRRPIIIELGELDPPPSISLPIFYWQTNKVQGCEVRAELALDWHLGFPIAEFEKRAFHNRDAWSRKMN